MKRPAAPLKRDPPNADKSPPHHIGGKVRLAPTSLQGILAKASKTHLSFTTFYLPILEFSCN